MKLRTFATVTGTLLGAALVGYGQEQQQDRAPASGSPAAEQQTNQPGQTTDTNRPAGATGTTGTQAPRPGQATDQNRAGQNQAQTQNQARSSAQPGQEVDWDKAQKSDMPLSGIPARARDTLTTVTKDGKLADQVTRLTSGNQQVYKATVNRENEEDLHIFVKEDGTVMKTKQKVELSSVPQSVRSAIDTRMGQDTSADAKEVHRVIADDETTYVVGKTGEDDMSKMLYFDNTGQLIEKDRANRNTADRPTTGQDASDRSASPDTVRPPIGGKPGTGGPASDRRD